MTCHQLLLDRWPLRRARKVAPEQDRLPEESSGFGRGLVPANPDVSEIIGLVPEVSKKLRSEAGALVPSDKQSEGRRTAQMKIPYGENNVGNAHLKSRLGYICRLGQ